MVKHNVFYISNIERTKTLYTTRGDVTRVPPDKIKDPPCFIDGTNSIRGRISSEVSCKNPSLSLDSLVPEATTH